MTQTIPTLDYKELKQKLNNIKNPTERILLKTIYASLGRVGEIVNTRYTNYPNPAITKSHIKSTNKFLFINLKTEKRQTPRKVPLSRIDLPNEQYFKKNEAWLTEDILNYISIFKPQDKLWNRSTRWAELIFKKHFEEYNNHIHYLRHWRASHLLSGYATGERVPENIVAKMGGWKGTNTLTATYDGTTVENYINDVGESTQSIQNLVEESK